MSSNDTAKDFKKIEEPTERNSRKKTEKDGEKRQEIDEDVVKVFEIPMAQSTMLKVPPVKKK